MYLSKSSGPLWLEFETSRISTGMLRKVHTHVALVVRFQSPLRSRALALSWCNLFLISLVFSTTLSHNCFGGQAVRRADAVDASVENRFDIEDDSDSSGDDMGSGTEDDSLIGFDDAEKANSSVIGDGNCVSEEDLSGREEGKGEGWDFNGCHGSLGDFGVDELTNEGQISAAAPAAAATSKSKSEELQGETNPGVVVEEALDSGHGTDEALQPESHMSAPQSLAARLSARFQRNSPSSSTLESDIDRQGFFWGTAQLALSPNAMLRKTLHPSIAPPSCLSISSRDTCVSGLLRERSSRLCGGEGARRVRDDRVQLEKSVASAADAVAEVLPPSVVLESCVLSPLREHCRLTSSSCLGVFVEELEIAKIMGELLGYLSDEPSIFSCRYRGSSGSC